MGDGVLHTPSNLVGCTFGGPVIFTRHVIKAAKTAAFGELTKQAASRLRYWDEADQMIDPQVEQLLDVKDRIILQLEESIRVA